jgi:hypothetical protein
MLEYLGRMDNGEEEDAYIEGDLHQFEDDDDY